MANGDLCIHCGMQETTHKYPEYATKGTKPCRRFESPVKHHKDCPVINCYGNCEETLAQQALNAERAENRLRNSWYLDRRTGKIVSIDMSG